MITPQTETKELAGILGVPALYFKREDLHPYGSHKGRSIPHMIDIKSEKGARQFVISSSGNAALAAIHHIQKKNSEGGNFSLTVITGEHINPAKKQILQSEIKDNRITLVESKRPLQMLFEIIRGKQAESLRQSNDPDALLGYESLAEEIDETPNLSAIFVGASSGTTAQALAEHVVKNKRKVAVYAVQTTENSPLVEKYQTEKLTKEKSLADAIVDKIGHRKNALQNALEKTNGSGLVVTNQDIVKAQEMLKKYASIEATPNGILGFAGLLKTLENKTIFNGSVVCVITGK